MDIEKLRNKRVLIVGIGKTGFALLNFFNRLDCEISVSDHKPIFELNKAVKKLKKLRPTPQMTLGEHKSEDFLDADIVVYSASVSHYLPQLELARLHGKMVFSEFSLAYHLCRVPIIAVCGSFGRTAVAHMMGHGLKMDEKVAFVGGSSENPFINLWTQFPEQQLDYAVVEVSAMQLGGVSDFRPHVAIYTNVAEKHFDKRFKTLGEYIETKLRPIQNMGPEDYLVVNFDKLANNTFFRKSNAQVYWYTRRSFVKMGVMDEINGTHFHDRRIHSHIHHHSEFSVKKMKIVGENNRENLLAAISALKAARITDKAIQLMIEKFPGIPHRLEFVVEKNGVKFYNDSKSETMPDMVESIKAYKEPLILIAGGRDTEQSFDEFFDILAERVRVLVLVGESKERFNRILGNACQTYLVGSFEESVLIAYQKSRTGDTILLSPGNSSTDIFRDYEERGNYFKKLVFQL